MGESQAGCRVHKTGCVCRSRCFARSLAAYTSSCYARRRAPSRITSIARSAARCQTGQTCRHGPAACSTKKGLSFYGDSFVTLQDLIRLRRFAGASEDAIWNEVTLDKARFEVKVVHGHRMVRATYKHSETEQVGSCSRPAAGMRRCRKRL